MKARAASMRKTSSHGVPISLKINIIEKYFRKIISGAEEGGYLGEIYNKRCRSFASKKDQHLPNLCCYRLFEPEGL